MITVPYIHKENNFYRLFNLTPYSFNNDWFGNILKDDSLTPPLVFLYLSDTFLFFGTKFYPPFNFKSNMDIGEFCEGLWERDVAELFISADKEKYQEINLSPKGAYWVQNFSSYRNRLTNSTHLQLDDTAVFTRSNKDGSIDSALRLPLTALSYVFNKELSLGDQLYINVAAIIGIDPRYYFALNSNSSSKPDFHKLEWFLPATIVSLNSK